MSATDEEKNNPDLPAECEEPIEKNDKIHLNNNEAATVSTEGNVLGTLSNNNNNNFLFDDQSSLIEYCDNIYNETSVNLSPDSVKSSSILLSSGSNYKNKSPKRVSFEKSIDLDEQVLKFVRGDVIVDQENPFRSSDFEDDAFVDSSVDSEYLKTTQQATNYDAGDINTLESPNLVIKEKAAEEIKEDTLTVPVTEQIIPVKNNCDTSCDLDEAIPKLKPAIKPRSSLTRSRKSLTSLSPEAVEILKNRYSPASFGFPKLTNSSDLTLKEKIEGKTVGKREKCIEDQLFVQHTLPCETNEENLVLHTDQLDDIFHTDSEITEFDQSINKVSEIDSKNKTVEEELELKQDYIYTESSPIIYSQINHIEKGAVHEPSIRQPTNIPIRSNKNINNSIINKNLLETNKMADKTKKKNSGLRKIFPTLLFSKSPKPPIQKDMNIEVQGNEKVWVKSPDGKSTRRIILEAPRKGDRIEPSVKSVKPDKIKISKTKKESSVNLEDRFNQIQRDLYNAQKANEEYVYMNNLGSDGTLRKSEYLNMTQPVKLMDSNSSSSSTLVSDNSDAKKHISQLKTPARYNDVKSGRILTPPSNYPAKLEKPVRRILVTPSNNRSASSSKSTTPVPDKDSNFSNVLRVDSKHSLKLVRPRAVIPITTDRALPNALPKSLENVEKPYVEDDQTLNPEYLPRSSDRKVMSFNDRHKSSNKHIQTPIYDNVPNSQQIYANKRSVLIQDSNIKGVSAEVKITKTPLVYGGPRLRPRSLSPEQRHKLDGSVKVPSNLEILPDLEFGDREVVQEIVAQVEVDHKTIPAEKSNNDNSSADYSLYKQILQKDDAVNDSRNNMATPKASSTPKQALFSPNISEKNTNVQISNKQNVLPTSPQKNQNMQNLEAFYWEQKRKEMSPITVNVNITTSDPRIKHSTYHNVQSQSFSSLESSPRLGSPSSQSPAQRSSQKMQNLQNVEAFCWKKLHEIKRKKEAELYMNCFSDNFYQNGPQHANVMLIKNQQYDPRSNVRSRSVSPGFSRNDSRSMSLPRQPSAQYGSTSSTTNSSHQKPDVPNRDMMYGTINQPQDIRTSFQNISFVRNSPQRNTISHTGDRTVEPNYRSIDIRNLEVPRRAQDYRSQSVLDEMIAGQTYGVVKPNPDARIMQRVINSQNAEQLEHLPPKRSPNIFFGPQFQRPAQKEPQYAPIFKRGSLLSSEDSTSPSSVKRVSFSNGQSDPNISSNNEMWPTRHGVKLPPSSRSQRVGDQPSSNNGTRPEVVYRQTTQGPKQINVNDKVCDIYGRIHDSKAVSVSGDQLAYRPIRVPQNRQELHENYIKNPQLLQVANRGGVQSASPNTGQQQQYARRPLPPVPKRSPDTKRTIPDLNVGAIGLGKPSSDPRIARRIDPRADSRVVMCYESESGSEAGEVQKILLQGMLQEQQRREEDWSDGKGGGGGGRPLAGDSADAESARGRGGRQGSRSREDPRRHTLGGDMLYAQQQPLRSLDLEAPPVRGYAPLGLGSVGPLFDDDPGIMSEVETSSTGFRRGGKQRSSLPVVRTPSKTLERPLGLVFLQYRNETKRALLPNEITSIDTVRALFVRSFPRQLTMAYLEGPHVKIYIHDSSKDMFYELEDLRSHLRDIRDRSVLRLFESAEVSGGPMGLGQAIAPVTPVNPASWGDADQSYFSEPEFDSEYQHQHIHKSKAGKAAPYYVGGSSTLPRAPLGYSNDRKSLPPTDGYMSSPERGASRSYEEPYYSQYGGRGGAVTPVIDEEASDSSLLDEGYSLYGVKLPPGAPRGSRPPSAQPYEPQSRHSEDLHRMRVEHMERQLANLTGLVQKALIQTPPTAAPREFLQLPNHGYRTDKSVSFEKSVSFSDEPPGVAPKQHSPQHSERDRLKPLPPPKPLGLAPPGGSIYRGDLALAPEVYNQLRGLQKKAKDLRTEVRTLRRMSQAQAVAVREDIRDAFIRIRATLLAGGGTYRQPDQEKIRLNREEELYKQEVLRLETDLSELEGSVESLRGEVINRRTRVNMSAVEDMALVLSRASKTVAELKMRFPGLQQGLRVALAGEMEEVVREEKFLKEEPERLESALRRCKKLTGTLVTLKRLASVQEQRLPGPLTEPPGESPPPTTPSSSQSKALPGARLVSDAPVGSLFVGVGGGASAERPENALDALLDELQTFSRPCDGSVIADTVSDDPNSDDNGPVNTVTTQMSQNLLYEERREIADPSRKGSMDSALPPHPNSAHLNLSTGQLRRLHSYPSGSDTDNSPPIVPAVRSGKPPVPERNSELLSQLAGRRIPPPPPPRTSSRSPLASPTSPHLPPRAPVTPVATTDNGTGTLRRNAPNRSSLKDKCQTLPRNIGATVTVPGNTLAPLGVPGDPTAMLPNSNSSSCESVNSQDGAKKSGNRHQQLEMRHQELLKKQKALQEQYARLQQSQRGNNALVVVPVTPDLLLKKTGSESNLLVKMNLNMAPAFSGSLTHLSNASSGLFTTAINPEAGTVQNVNTLTPNTTPGVTSTTNKVYETDIL